MRSSLVLIAVLSTSFISLARAATPLYSFETLYDSTGNPSPTGKPDGFGPNGGGTTVLQDTVGATNGPHSLLFSMVQGATFSGAQTPIIPPVINDPSTYALVCDLTITGTQFSGVYARLGITEFGSNPNLPVAGSAQTTGEAEANIALPPGTYHITIPLIARQNDLTFDSNVPFYTIFGPDPDTQLTPTSFQFYINKTNDAPISIYIDNVRVAKPGDINGDGRINADDYALIDRGLHGAYTSATPPGWINGDLNTDGVVNSNDYLILDTALAHQQGSLSPALLANRQSTFGDAYVSQLLASIPEPSSASLLLACAAPLLNRKRSTR